MALTHGHDLVVLAGPPGAGKTTFAHAHFRDHVQVDWENLIRACFWDGRLKYEGEVKAATKRMRLVGVEYLLSRGVSTLIASAGASVARRLVWVELAHTHRCTAHLILFQVNPETAKTRCRLDPNRPRGKQTWDAIVSNWYRRWEVVTPAEGWDSYAEFDTNDPPL